MGCERRWQAALTSGTIVETQIDVDDADELATVVDAHLPPMPPGWGAPPR